MVKVRKISDDIFYSADKDKEDNADKSKGGDDVDQEASEGQTLATGGSKLGGPATTAGDKSQDANKKNTLTVQ